MKIIVFGTKRCKFCEIQKSYLENRFKKDDWMYVDVVKDIENLRIAASVNIDSLPTIVLLDENNKEIFRREGTLPPDQIFHILNENSIPIMGDGNRVLLSYDPKLIDGNVVKAHKVDGDFLYDVIIKSCKRISVKSKHIRENERKAYIERGGRRDVCWVVDFLPTKGNKEVYDA